MKTITTTCDRCGITQVGGEKDPCYGEDPFYHQQNILDVVGITGSDYCQSCRLELERFMAVIRKLAKNWEDHYDVTLTFKDEKITL